MSSPIEGWTDYPFVALGDEKGKCGPCRRVRVHAYDGDKYAVVQLDNDRKFIIKRWYIYSVPEACCHVNSEEKVLDVDRLEVASLADWFRETEYADDA